jgi:hypothetical protein
MPQLNPDMPNMCEARIIREEQYDSLAQVAKVRQMCPLLNESQRKCFTLITEATSESTCNSFVVDSPGGYGKTFLFACIAAHLRSQGNIVLIVASTGLAAQNLEGGRTAHSRFKIPLDVQEDSTCHIKTQTALARLIQQSRIVIWDEIFSCHRHNIEAVERTVRDLMNSEKPWGGKTVVFGGDPRQTLPVVKKAGRAGIVKASFKMSHLYEQAKRLVLSQNMRTDPEEICFSEFLLKLGEGKLDFQKGTGELFVKIPEQHLVSSTQELIDKIFPNLSKNTNVEDLIENAIYTPLNKNVRDVNTQCINALPGTPKTFLSADYVLEDECNRDMETEFLNSLDMSGLPDHELTLKIGCPVMLLRNLQASPQLSLRNGTRMKVVGMMERAIEVEVAVGPSKGSRVFLPRIPHYDRSNDFPFTIVRRQFPVRLAFCITINKGQGQTNQKVGIYLPDPVFAHGQLYTAFSRGKRGRDVCVFTAHDGGEEGHTNNIVYKELITIQ